MIHVIYHSRLYELLFSNTQQLFKSATINYNLQIIELDPGKHKESSIDWNSKLSTFERMMILKALKEEKVKVTFNYE